MINYKIVTKRTPRIAGLPYEQLFTDPQRGQVLLDDFMALNKAQHNERSEQKAMAMAILVTEMKKIEKPKETLDKFDVWTLNAHKLVEYNVSDAVKQLLNTCYEKYSGMILEAMCGHMSYFGESSTTTVIALDGCEASLERYTHPNRARICCDLDQITKDQPLDLFQKNQFDVVSVTFGFRYPKNIIAILRDFRRILKPKGILSLFESPYHGYEDMVVRQALVDDFVPALKKAGFAHMDITEYVLPRRVYYHVEAPK